LDDQEAEVRDRRVISNPFQRRPSQAEQPWNPDIPECVRPCKGRPASRRSDCCGTVLPTQDHKHKALNPSGRRPYARIPRTAGTISDQTKVIEEGANAWSSWQEMKTKGAK